MGFTACDINGTSAQVRLGESIDFGFSAGHLDEHRRLGVPVSVDCDGATVVANSSDEIGPS